MIRTEHHDPQWKFPFISYIPETVAGKLPLILQLHGAGERGEGGEDLKRVEIHGFPKIMGGEYPCLFVFPQCPRDSFWAARVESILAFIDQLKQNFDIDESRIYLTGLSMGGYGTWYTAMAKPSLFAAIVPVCGGGMAWNAGVLKMPIWTFHGLADETVSANQTIEMIEKLKKTNENLRYNLYEGVGHNSWDLAFSEELLEWFFANKKTE